MEGFCTCVLRTQRSIAVLGLLDLSDVGWELDTRSGMVGLRATLFHFTHLSASIREENSPTAGTGRA